MSLFVLTMLIMAAWFFVSCLVVVFLVACAIHVQDRRQEAIEATERWHVPDTLPADWDLSREIR